MKDEDREVRRFVRAKNMDERGHGKYNIINGMDRRGIDEVIPETLSDRYA